MFGINAELLIDHAWGWEPCTIQDIKSYRPSSNSVGSGQVLTCPYSFEKTRLVIRVPVIPTFNDSVEEIQAIARFAASLPGVNKIHLLPYHRLGQDKYEGLGRPYLMEGILPPTAEHMQMLKNAVHAVCSLDCQIGG